MKLTQLYKDTAEKFELFAIKTEGPNDLMKNRVTYLYKHTDAYGMTLVLKTERNPESVIKSRKLHRFDISI